MITSKEQEKDLKAFTCKNCGSTIFIAKTREFFFEGDTGIGGLGCFTCGAKGKENFVMDRDRIVEDVADIDDYFDYERPLDFVSRAERRKLLAEAKGDEERANQLLVDRANEAAGISPADTTVSSSVVTEEGNSDGAEGATEDVAADPVVDAQGTDETVIEEETEVVEAETIDEAETIVEAETIAEVEALDEAETIAETVVPREEPAGEPKAISTRQSPESVPASSTNAYPSATAPTEQGATNGGDDVDDLDILDMDEW